MLLGSASLRTPAYKPGLAWFAALGSAWVFVLVAMGAFTTSIGAGMVFPDWPLSNGSLNPNGWLSDLAMFAEHSHRLSAGLMSMITIAIVVWLWRTESRSWLRRLAVAAVVLIFIQAFVGGLRVLLENHRVKHDPHECRAPLSHAACVPRPGFRLHPCCNRRRLLTPLA